MEKMGGKMGRVGLFACFSLLLWLPSVPHVRANIVEPPFVDFGIKCMLSLSNMYANDDASFKGTRKNIEGSDITSVIGTWVRPGLYTEFVLTDFFGIQTGAYYLSQYCHLAPKRKGGSERSDIRPVKFRSHGLSLPLLLCFYPTGREVDESFITLFFGLDFLLTLKSEFDARTQRLKDAENKERLGLFNFAGLIGVNFQLPIGLFVECIFDFWVLNALSHTSSLAEQGAKKKKYEYTMFSGLNALNALNATDVSFGIGYNFGALLYR